MRMQTGKQRILKKLLKIYGGSNLPEQLGQKLSSSHLGTDRRPNSQEGFACLEVIGHINLSFLATLFCFFRVGLSTCFFFSCWLIEIFYGVKNAKRKYKLENIAKIVNGPSIDLEFFKQRGIYELRQMGDPSNFVSNSEASAEEAPIV